MLLFLLTLVAMFAAIIFFLHDWAVFFRELDKAAKGESTNYFSKNFNNNK
jgi:hypothetical protein